MLSAAANREFCACVFKEHQHRRYSYFCTLENTAEHLEAMCKSTTLEVRKSVKNEQEQQEFVAENGW